MATAEQWLSKLAKLRIDRASGDPAPHKPLLLLAILEFSDRGELRAETLPLSPELAFQFYTYWTIVAHRRTQRPDVRLPFHYLSSDGFWSVLDEQGSPSKHYRNSHYAVMPSDFVSFANEPAARDRARRILIATYFQPEERAALYSMFGMPIPSDDQIARDGDFRSRDEAKERGREARFRLNIVAIYKYTCALTGYRLTTVTAGSIVDAAHIHQFSDSRNNNPKNGLALCKNAHWQFDQGLWSISDDYRVDKRTAEIIKQDLEAARDKWLKEAEKDPVEHQRRAESQFLAYENDQGRVVDFHALRMTFITNLTHRA